MPKNTTDEFLKQSLIELEKIVQQLELEEDFSFSPPVVEADETFYPTAIPPLPVTKPAKRSGQQTPPPLESFTDE